MLNSDIILLNITVLLIGVYLYLYFKYQKLAKNLIQKELEDYMIDMGFKSDDGKDYYFLALDLVEHKVLEVKNASCIAVIQNKLFGKRSTKEYRIYFLGDTPEIDWNKIPKKYHRFIREAQCC